MKDCVVASYLPDMENQNNGLESAQKNPVKINGSKVTKRKNKFNGGFRIYRRNKTNLPHRIPRLWKRNSKFSKTSKRTHTKRLIGPQKMMRHDSSVFLRVLRSHIELETIFRLMDIKLQVLELKLKAYAMRKYFIKSMDKGYVRMDSLFEYGNV